MELLPILEGIAEFVHTHKRWQVALEHGHEHQQPAHLRKIDADGLVYFAVSPQIVDAATSRGLPAVNVTGWLDRLPPASVVTDETACGRIAAEHLLDLGIRDFMAVNVTEARFARLRAAGFLRRVRASGRRCVLARDLVQAWDMLPRLAAQSAGPVGLFGEGDPLVASLVHRFNAANLRVPDDVAVVGVSNNQTVCELCSPTLSSVDQNLQRRGYEAAALLERLMQGEPTPDQPLWIPPRGVAARESTDVLATADQDVIHAARFIRQHAHHRISPAQVADEVMVSRRSLDQRFLATFGRTVHEEIWHHHIERAKRLLNETDQSLYDVAVRSGFRSASAMSTIFKRHTGMSPRAYRQQRR